MFILVQIYWHGKINQLLRATRGFLTFFSSLLFSPLLCSSLRKPLTPRVITLLCLVSFVQQTDDKGVFSTTLSQEYSIIADTLNLTEHQLWQLSLGSIDYIFAEDSVKHNLKQQWEDEKDTVFSRK